MGFISEDMEKLRNATKAVVDFDTGFIECPNKKVQAALNADGTHAIGNSSFLFVSEKDRVRIPAHYTESLTLENGKAVELDRVGDLSNVFFFFSEDASKAMLKHMKDKKNGFTHVTDDGKNYYIVPRGQTIRFEGIVSRYVDGDVEKVSRYVDADSVEYKLL